MAGSVNKVILIGHLGKDPESRTFQNGNKVTQLRLATSETWKDRTTGEKREKTEWHAVSVFGPPADIAERYLKKGSRVYICGSLQTRKWQDQSGQDRYTTEVVVQGFGGEIVLLDRASGGGGEGGGYGGDYGGGYGGGGGGGRDKAPPSSGGGQGWDRSPGPAGGAGDLDDDIPF